LNEVNICVVLLNEVNICVVLLNSIADKLSGRYIEYLLASF